MPSFSSKKGMQRHGSFTTKAGVAKAKRAKKKRANKRKKGK